MRVLVVNSRSDVEALGLRLGRERSARTLDEIERLNPHVDFKKIERGTVLLVPDLPSDREGESRSIQGQAFEDLRDQVTEALEASSARVRRGYEALDDEAKEVTGVLKSAPLKRAMEADQELKQQVEAAAAVFKQDAAEAKAAEQTLKAMRDQVGQELNALAKLLG